MIGNIVACLAFLLCYQHGIEAQVGDITPGPIVNTLYGQVQGNNVPLEEPQGVVYSFWNVPYAKPPVGNLRFERPLEPDAWSGVRYNDSIGVACPGGRTLFLLTQPGFNSFDEDCLYLNVFTSDLNARNPVMVFFHGGGYTSGGAIQYPGHFLAAQGTVVVTVNYRLGNLGFLTTGDSVVPGNAAMFDQRQALLWVQFNIAAFGGDRDSVTIFGQSAGASSSSLHIVSPQSQGLFHRAIMESGTDFSLWAVNWPIQNPANYTRQVAEKWDCPTTDSQLMVDCLREVPWQHLWNTSFECTPGTFCQGMAPVIDGPGGFIPDHPINLRAQGRINKVPIITGLCREDGSLYTYALLPDTSQGFNRSEFERNLRDNLLSYFTAMFPPEREEDVFNAINWYYSPWPHVDDEYLNREAFNFMVTDAGFGYAADFQAKHQSQYAPSYVYVFGFRSSNMSALVPEWMGVPHMGDIPYVFGYPLLQLNRNVRLDTRIYDIIDWNAEDIAYANYFMPMIANFARTSNPTPTPVVPPTGGPAFYWTPYDGVNRDSLSLTYLLVDNVTNEVRTDYRQQAYSFFSEYMSYFAGYDLVPPNVPIAPVEPSGAATRRTRPRKFPSLPSQSGNPRTKITKKSMRSDAISNRIDDFVEELMSKVPY